MAEGKWSDHDQESREKCIILSSDERGKKKQRLWSEHGWAERPEKTESKETTDHDRNKNEPEGGWGIGGHCTTLFATRKQYKNGNHGWRTDNDDKGNEGVVTRKESTPIHSMKCGDWFIWLVKYICTGKLANKLCNGHKMTQIMGISNWLIPMAKRQNCKFSKIKCRRYN